MGAFWKKNQGLTLVELMVSIAIGTMIFAAATTVLLLGVRINHHATDSVMQQYTARMVVTMLEDLAAEGDMGEIKRSMDGSWVVHRDKTKNSPVVSYSAVQQAIYTNAQTEPILENVIASYLIYDDKSGLLTISLEDHDTTYTSTVFCRITPQQTGNAFEDKPEDLVGAATGDKYKAKQEFINLLMTQVGVQGGLINHDSRTNARTITENEADTGRIICESVCSLLCHKYNFFSQWYIGGYEDHAGWGPETPWCACFVSWGLCHMDGLTMHTGKTRWYANVDDFMAYFTQDTSGGWKINNPSAGDIIFFDMLNGTTDNPSHVGVVLSVENGTVTTIEGNSADMVAIREYSLSDTRILGYGDPWEAVANQKENSSKATEPSN